jgi:DNA-binding NtrC family response regulator
VRELENVLEQAMLNSDAHTLEAADFAGLALAAADPAPAPATIRGAVAEAEARALEAALEASGGNRSRAARMLGIGRTTLYQRLKRPGSSG